MYPTVLLWFAIIPRAPGCPNNANASAQQRQHHQHRTSAGDGRQTLVMLLFGRKWCILPGLSVIMRGSPEFYGTRL